MSSLNDILTYAVSNQASDIFIVPYHSPIICVHKQMQTETQYGEIQPYDSENMVKEMVGEKRFSRLEQYRDLDFSYRIEGVGRFRVNAHYQRETIAIAFRVITPEVPGLDVLNLPPIVQDFANLPRGLVLVTGPTGSGKSTTLASLISAMNQAQRKHVITLEDPVEYELLSNQCLIEQREVGSDVPDFASGLKHALRQAPDVIMVGEMRDLETTSAALSAGETGHLVLSTLHTQSASQTIERIVDIYPGARQKYILSMLANTLQAVITQTLFTRSDTPGMIPALEIMICTPAVRNCIRENRIHEISNIIETNRSMGMCLLDDAIKVLYLNGRITAFQAIERANNAVKLRKEIGV